MHNTWFEHGLWLMARKRPKGRAVKYRPSDYPTTLIRDIYARSYANLSVSLSRYGLAPVDWRILSTLQESDGHNIAYLAERTATERSNLSRSVDKLEGLGLVRRQREPRDRRHVQLYLTKTGRKKFDDVMPVVLWNIDRVVEGFSADERKTLMELLHRVRGNVHRAGEASNVA
jgi:MarR family transcriptional regulator, organic hydroperoxide resistance regulator